MNVYSIQELLKCLNPLLIIPHAWNINRNYPVTLQVKKDMILQYFTKWDEWKPLEVMPTTPWIHKQQL